MKKIYKIIFLISLALVAISIIALSVYGLKFGVDFKGGTIIEVDFKDTRPEIAELQKVLVQFPELSINSAGDKGMVIKTKELNEDEHQLLLVGLKGKYDIEEKRFESIGPVIGKELKNKSLVGIMLVLISIVIYIAFVFRKLTKTLSPWAMGVAAIVALVHDVIIPLGIFAILGSVYGIEITAIFVAAVLTILGYSVSDTVVVFDRVRENVIKGTKESFGEIVHKSVMQTLARSLNTTITTLLSLLAIYFFGGESIKYFSLMLIIGIFLGAYSSIFVASPLLVYLQKKRK